MIDKIAMEPGQAAYEAWLATMRGHALWSEIGKVQQSRWATIERTIEARGYAAAREQAAEIGIAYCQKPGITADDFLLLDELVMSIRKMEPEG